MSRDAVIKGIVKREKDRASLVEEIVQRDAPELHALALEHFGAWRVALRYAGVRPVVRRSRKQTPAPRDPLALRLRHFVTCGRSVAPDRAAIKDPELYRDALASFGSWNAALRSVGFVVEESTGAMWQSTEILRRIRALRDAGATLKFGDNILRHQRLVRSAKRRFGSWGRAVLAALGPLPAWSDQRVVQAIGERHARRLSLKRVDAIRDDRALVRAARQFFGGWGKAVKASGCRDQPVDRRAVKSMSIATWLRYVLRNLVRLDADSIASRYPEQFAACELAFGSWDAALRSEGLVSSRATGHKWSRAEVASRLRALLVTRPSLRFVDCLRIDRDLAFSAKSHFNSWTKALAEALPHPRKRIKWTRELILERLREFRTRQADLPRDCRRRLRQKLYLAIQRHFGDMETAMLAAGLPWNPREKDRPVPRSAPIKAAESP